MGLGCSCGVLYAYDIAFTFLGGYLMWVFEILVNESFTIRSENLYCHAKPIEGCEDGPSSGELVLH